MNRNYILMLHRVHADCHPSPVGPNQNLSLSIDVLETFILKAKKMGWSFITIDELYLLIKKKQDFKKCLVVSFDDGYLDNFNIGRPALVSLSVPFIIYICGGFLNNRLGVPWWYQLEFALLEFFNGNAELSLEADISKSQSFDGLFNYIRHNLMYSGKNLCDYFPSFDFSSNKISKRFSNLFMSSNELINLSECQYGTIGGHGFFHKVLAGLSEADFQSELDRSRELIEGLTRKRILHFAYPYGGVHDFGHREKRTLEKDGFLTSVSTKFGGVGPKSDLFELNRINLVDFSSMFDIERHVFKFNIKKKVKEYFR